MARRPNSSRTTTVGIAIAAPALRRAVIDALAAGRRYEAAPFPFGDVANGDWPPQRYAAVVATPDAFRAWRRYQAPRADLRSPLIIVVRQREIVREKAVLAVADAFVLAERLDSLPSIVVLGAHRLSIMPRSLLAPSMGRASAARQHSAKKR